MAKRRLFAEDSSVPVDRSRNEIRDLLAAWGCNAMGWTDHFAEAAVELGFIWDPAVIARVGKKPEHCPKGYEHRWALTCVPCNWKDGFAAGTGEVYKVRMRVKVGSDPQAQRTAHRLLLLKIKGDLNAAQAGLVKAEEVFLPYIVDSHGRTVADVVLPQLKTAYAAALPPAGGTGGTS